MLFSHVPGFSLLGSSFQWLARCEAPDNIIRFTKGFTTEMDDDKGGNCTIVELCEYEYKNLTDDTCREKYVDIARLAMSTKNIALIKQALQYTPRNRWGNCLYMYPHDVSDLPIDDVAQICLNVRIDEENDD